jgi:hypothetical protein
MGKRGGRRKTEPRDERGLTGDLTAASGTMADWATVKVPRKTKAPPPELPDPAEAVARGAAWLDAVAPVTLRRMDSRTVDVQSVVYCPLSNAFPMDDGRPSFRNGVRMLCNPQRVLVQETASGSPQGSSGRRVQTGGAYYTGATTETLSHHGFAPHPLQTLPDPYSLLNALWAAEIRLRQS